MKTLLNTIQEKLHITKNTGKNVYIDNIGFNLIKKVFTFYIENFLSQDEVDNIKKNGLPNYDYETFLDHINNIIADAENNSKSVRAILFNNEFKDKEEVKKITDLFINLPNNSDKELDNEVKELFLNICKNYEE